MAFDHTPWVCFSVFSIAQGGCCNNVVSAKVGTDIVPDLIHGHVFNVLFLPWSAHQVAHAHGGLAANDMQEIPLHFGESFLKDHGPEGVVVADASVNRLVFAIFVFFEWNVVVNHGGLRDAQSKKVDSVASTDVKTCLKCPLHPAFMLRDCRSRCEEPAISKCTLVDVGRFDVIISIEVMIFELFML